MRRPIPLNAQAKEPRLSLTRFSRNQPTSIQSENLFVILLRTFHRGRNNCQAPIPIAARAIRCHRGKPDQAFAKTPGINTSATTMPRVAPIRLRASAGFPMPSRSRNAVTKNAAVASEPVSARRQN